ncbi:nitroreductase [Sphingomonas sp. CGMCC 1.13654]|uniref:Nitroreductase n=1 Tax=Sphingomonas chungangi TaxID=2683589 RepID=A0A838L8A6_9SPHN|nr:nitroreductase [Sphingomonas chungangi]MBA2933768.1 nitroreductase [Sphingomonas chungangi]MVW55099.1 nitroreductase [Sphingomonas chungangi]
MTASADPPPLFLEPAAAFAKIVAERRSVRGFRPDPVPDALIERIFTIAGQAPSNCNAQPWITHLVSGASLARIRAMLRAEAEAKRFDPDVPVTTAYAGAYKARRIGAAVALFEATGVGRDDEAARQASTMRNFDLFDAPHAAFIFMPRVFGMREAADIGMYAQTLMLALTAHGLASCPQAAIGLFAGALKRELGIADDLICLFGISFGRADEAHPSCNAITRRAPLAELLVRHD